MPEPDQTIDRLATATRVLGAILVPLVIAAFATSYVDDDLFERWFPESISVSFSNIFFPFFLLAASGLALHAGGLLLHRDARGPRRARWAAVLMLPLFPFGTALGILLLYHFRRGSPLRRAFPPPPGAPVPPSF